MKRTSRILVVDDNLDVLLLLAEMLRTHGYEVWEASTGRQGLEMARSLRPEVLLLDVVMPEMGGIEVCREIKADPLLADVFVVLVSGKATTSAEMIGGLEAGADEYIAKPVDAAEFLARIQTIARLRDTTAALRSSERHYHSLVDLLPDGICMIDSEGIIADANPRALALFGYTHRDRDQLLQRNIRELVDAADHERFKWDMASALKKGAMRNAEYTMIRKGGHRFAAEMSTAVFAGGKNLPQRMVVVARDITKRKRAEEDLRSMSRRIIEAQEAERLRVARELHDGVNQVLASAKMRLRKVEELATNLTPAAREILGRSHRLIVQALEENRRIAYNLRPSDLDELGLPAACQNFCKELGIRTNLKVSCRVGRLPDRLAGSVELNLFRIIQEAVANIEKHAQASNVRVRLGRTRDWVVLEVRDDGRGFDVKQTTAGRKKWSGNGVSNMHQRAMAMGGTCEVKSVLKKGTVITVRVLYKPARREANGTPKRAGKAASPPV